MPKITMTNSIYTVGLIHLVWVYGFSLPKPMLNGQCPWHSWGRDTWVPLLTDSNYPLTSFPVSTFRTISAILGLWHQLTVLF